MPKSKKVKQYEQDFFDKNGYIFCEECHVNNSFAFSVHHCHFKSQFPKHPKIDNPLNLKILCAKCHKKSHSDSEFANKLRQDSYDLFHPNR